MIITENMDPRVIETGKDSIGLGIWAWIRLQGKNHAITLLSASRPYKPSTSGIHTVYEQYATVLSLDQEPISQF